MGTFHTPPDPNRPPGRGDPLSADEKRYLVDLIQKARRKVTPMLRSIAVKIGLYELLGERVRGKTDG